MTEPSSTTEIVTPAGAARPGTVKRLLADPLGDTALVFIALVILIAVVGPTLISLDPNRADLANAFQAPTSTHWLGTDSAGRDLLARLVAGARSTLLAGCITTVVAVAIGVPTGLVAGYFGGAFDGIANWCMNVLLSLPTMIILLAASASLGKSMWVSMTTFGILMAPIFYRLTRTAVRSVRNELYVDAARVSGLSTSRIIGKHILFVVRAPLVIQASIVCGMAVSFSAALEFLGLGDPQVPTWGVMLNEGFLNIYTAPLLAIWPAVMISLTIGALVILGNALRDALEDPVPASKSRRARGHAASRQPDAGSVAPAEGHLLSVANLGVGYPQSNGGFKTVVDDVSFYVDRGEVLGIVGESGSGKTQTAFSVLGLLPLDAHITHGNITFSGSTLTSPQTGQLSAKKMEPLRGKRIAYIPQEPMSNLDPNVRIGQQLVRPMVKVLGIPRTEARARVLELLATVGIADPRRTFDAYPYEVSGGMAQRVLIAGAVSCEPDLLIADEPTTALDVTVQADVLDLLRNLQAKLGMAILMVTHNFGVVADLCDRVVVMQGGRVVESGAVGTILRTPLDEYTKTLLGSMLDGKTPLTPLSAQSAAQAGV